MRDAFNEEPEEIESCTVVLEDSGDNTHQPRETYYSDNLEELDRFVINKNVDMNQDGKCTCK